MSMYTLKQEMQPVVLKRWFDFWAMAILVKKPSGIYPQTFLMYDFPQIAKCSFTTLIANPGSCLEKHRV